MLQSFAQQRTTTITGRVRAQGSLESVAGATVSVAGQRGSGVSTNERGEFALTTARSLPLTLHISSLAFAETDVRVTGGQPLDIQLTAAYQLGSEVVVSASRLPERILESPVTIERVGAAAIRNAPAPSYYDVLGSLKGVDMTTTSYTFKTISTRGFNGSGNLRLNQLMDGMDNQAPGLNFSVGNFAGLTELDVESMELLSGASSALYGPGGMNGTLIINSKDPFKYQGFSFQVKQGIMHTDSYERSPAPFYNWSARYAKAFGRFAFRISSEFVETQDWLANSRQNYNRINPPSGVPETKPGDRTTDPAYDGVNVYGDETYTNISPVMQALKPFFPSAAGPSIDALSAQPVNVSRTGYDEKDVIGPSTVNFKVAAGLFYKLSDRVTASFSGYLGTGSSVYTGSDRYALKDLKLWQYKLELKADNWYVRAYTTGENSGSSFNATVTTRLFNEAWKPSGGNTGWFSGYTQAYLTSRLGGASDIAAHNAARAFADQGRPNGPLYDNALFQQVAGTPISKGGGLFLDKSGMYMLEGQYNFSDLLKVRQAGTDILVGANWKQYLLNSQGTLFADTAGRIQINEVGAYAQVSQKLFNDVLKLTASGRYDKNENFKGRFTPRVSAVIRIAKDQDIRLSYQTAYRFPSTQNQWINLVVGGGTYLIGGLPELRNYYQFDSKPVYTVASFQKYAVTHNPADLQQVNFGEFKAESSSSFEIGYKAVFDNRFLVDAYAYAGSYQDFISTINVVQASTGRIFSTVINSPGTVNTSGWGISAEYQLGHGFSAMANIFSDDISNVPAGLITFFNTPRYRFNIGLANSGFGHEKRWGFDARLRWQEQFEYEGTFTNGHLPDFATIDAQVSYKFPAIRSTIKLGGTNILNHYYQTGFGSPPVGALYYVGFGYHIY